MTMQPIPTTQAERKPEENEVSKLCGQCGQLFEPRAGSGGKPQRFCSTDCRLAFHSKGQRDANVAQTCSTLPAVIDPAPKPSADAPEASDFDWNDTERVVLTEQRETAVYWNPMGDLVIRQRGCWPHDDDTVVITAATGTGTFIDKLCDIVGIPSVGKPR
jgi:hypothetical protein